MKIWIDDCRPAPKGYKWHKSVNTAKRFIMEMELMNKPFHSAPIEVIDIDHDAGDFASDGGDYIELLKWLEATKRNYPIHKTKVVKCIDCGEWFEIDVNASRSCRCEKCEEM